MFKTGIRPLWESEQNKTGFEEYCEFKLPEIPKGKGNNRHAKHQHQQKMKQIQESWLRLVLMVIGNQFENNEVINGIEFNCRGSLLKIGVWISHTTPEIIMSIKSTIQTTLGSKILEKDIESELRKLEAPKPTE